MSEQMNSSDSEQVGSPESDQSGSSVATTKQLLPSDAGPFFRLAIEIRTMIYKEVLVLPKGEILQDMLPHALLRTNRMIRNEAIAMFYGDNEFEIDIESVEQCHEAFGFRWSWWICEDWSDEEDVLGTTKIIRENVKDITIAFEIDGREEPNWGFTSGQFDFSGAVSFQLSSESLFEDGFNPYQMVSIVDDSMHYHHKGLENLSNVQTLFATAVQPYYNKECGGLDENWRLTDLSDMLCDIMATFRGAAHNVMFLCPSLKSFMSRQPGGAWKEGFWIPTSDLQSDSESTNDVEGDGASDNEEDGNGSSENGVEGHGTTKIDEDGDDASGDGVDGDGASDNDVAGDASGVNE